MGFSVSVFHRVGPEFGSDRPTSRTWVLGTWYQRTNYVEESDNRGTLVPVTEQVMK